VSTSKVILLDSYRPNTDTDAHSRPTASRGPQSDR